MTKSFILINYCSFQFLTFVFGKKEGKNQIVDSNCFPSSSKFKSLSFNESLKRRRKSSKWNKSEFIVELIP